MTLYSQTSSISCQLSAAVSLFFILNLMALAEVTR